MGRILVRSGKPVTAALAELRAAGCEPQAVTDDIAGAVDFILQTSRAPAADDALSLNVPRASRLGSANS